MGKIYVVTLQRAFEGMANIFATHDETLAYNWLNDHGDDYAEVTVWGDNKLIVAKYYKWVDTGWRFVREDVNHYGE